MGPPDHIAPAVLGLELVLANTGHTTQQALLLQDAARRREGRGLVGRPPARHAALSVACTASRNAARLRAIY
jgi:hypothetical protein